jgi:hypothetical protein
MLGLILNGVGGKINNMLIPILTLALLFLCILFAVCCYNNEDGK